MYQDPLNHDIEMVDDAVYAGLLPPVPSGWSDPLTGTDGPRLWDRVISSEIARVKRYRRPATVLLVEVDPTLGRSLPRREGIAGDRHWWREEQRRRVGVGDLAVTVAAHVHQAGTPGGRHRGGLGA